MNIFNSLLITKIILLLNFIFVIILIYKDNFVSNIIKKHWKIILIIILINIIFKFTTNINGNFFYGLEYEDAFVFSASSRLITQNCQNDEMQSYQTNCCIWGSISDCYLTGQFSGHQIGYPSIISIFSNLFGYNKYIANIISIFMNIICVFFIFLISFLILDDIKYAIINCFIFNITPINNVFSSTSLSEPTSSSICSILLFTYLLYLHPIRECKNKNLEFYKLFSLFFLFLSSILIKRENIILIICLPISSVLYFSLYNNKILNNKKTLYKILYFIIIIFISFILSFKVFKIMGTLNAETNDIKAQPFSINYIFSILPNFIKGYANFKWYIYLPFFCLIGCFCVLKTKNLCFPFLCLCSFMVLYTSHYRSYYFIYNNFINPEECIRYMINIMPYYTLITGMGIFVFYKWINENIAKEKSKTTLWTIIAITLSIYSLTVCNDLTKSFLTDEYYVRISPVIHTLKNMKKDDFIITEEPLTFQTIASKDTKIIDYTSIGEAIPIKEIDKLIKEDKVIYLYKPNEEDSRFLKQKKYIESKNKENLIENNKLYFKIYRLH